MIMHMYCKAKLDTPEHFRVELSQFTSVMKITIAEEIQKRDNKYEVGKYPPVISHLHTNV